MRSGSLFSALIKIRKSKARTLSPLFSLSQHAPYVATYNYECIFHVPTMMPNNYKDPQQIHKKRHVGNDHVQIVSHCPSHPTLNTLYIPPPKCRYIYVAGYAVPSHLPPSLA